MLGLQLTGLSPQYSVGDSVFITCSTDLKVDRLVWLNDDGQEIANTFSEPLLPLMLNSVEESMNNALFTCQAQSEFGDQMLPVLLQVEDSSSSGIGVTVIGGAAAGGIVLLVLISTVVIILCICARKKSRYVHE